MIYMQRIRQYRQENKISQRKIAETLKITQQQYQKYEAGKNELPIRYLVVICREYRIDANWLLGLTD